MGRRIEVNYLSPVMKQHNEAVQNIESHSRYDEKINGANHHPNFTSKLQKRINKTKQGALWVRVTGQLMFDSEHFHHLKLNRATQWEIHPILKLEYCSKGEMCRIDSDDNWEDLDDQE